MRLRHTERITGLEAMCEIVSEHTGPLPVSMMPAVIAALAHIRPDTLVVELIGLLAHGADRCHALPPVPATPARHSGCRALR